MLYTIIFESDTPAGLLFDKLFAHRDPRKRGRRHDRPLAQRVEPPSLRVFRILKLTNYLAEHQLLGAALRDSRRKVAVFLATVLMIVVTLGTVMYVIEGPQHGFTSIPIAVYWAVTTMTTVTSQRLRAVTGRRCPQCGAGEHTADARFCRVCSATLGA